MPDLRFPLSENASCLQEQFIFFSYRTSLLNCHSRNRHHNAIDLSSIMRALLDTAHTGNALFRVYRKVRRINGMYRTFFRIIDHTLRNLCSVSEQDLHRHSFCRDGFPVWKRHSHSWMQSDQQNPQAVFHQLRPVYLQHTVT